MTVLRYKKVKFARTDEGRENIKRQSLQYLEFVYLMEKSTIVLTDSGGIQEEAPGLGKPVLVIPKPGVLANFDEDEIMWILEGESVSLVPCGRCGVFTKAGDKEAFKEAILRLYGDRGLCEEMGRNGREFILRNLTKEVGTRRYVEVVRGGWGEEACR